MKVKHYTTKKIFLYVVIIVPILLTVGFFIAKELYLTTDTSVIKSSKTTQNMIDSKARLITLSSRAEKEYGRKTTKNDFTILLEKETKNYFVEEVLLDIPELTIYDTYDAPGKTGKKTVEYRRVYYNNEVYKETVLNETIDVEALPSVYYQGTTNIVRHASQLIKNIKVLAETPSDFRFNIRSDENLDVYYRDRKFLFVDDKYLSFIYYPTIEEFMMIATITGNASRDSESLKDAYSRIKNGEKTIITDRFWLVFEGGQLKFFTPIPKRIGAEYMEIIDFDAYYEKYKDNAY